MIEKKIKHNIRMPYNINVSGKVRKKKENGKESEGKKRKQETKKN